MSWGSRFGLERPPLWAAIVMVAALVASAVMLLFVKSPTPPAAGGRTIEQAYPSQGAAAPIEQRQLADTTTLLDDPVRPFTVAIISDSTGAARASWVPQLATWMGETYDRPVTMHSWAVEVEPHGYQDPWTLVDGTNAPIEVWNGSAGGKNVAYSQEHLDELIPVPAEQVDLLIFSHGHNEPAGELVPDARGFLLSVAETYSNATVAVMLQNPERPDLERATLHDENVSALGAWAAAEGFPVIDGHAAYRALPGWETEFADTTGLHPSDRGYQVWAKAAIAAFDAARPAA